MTGAERIAAERRRQVEEEGWSAEHDDGHLYADLAVAAAVLACDWTDAEVRDPLGRTQGEAWPAQLMRRHGFNRIRQLEIAGALLAAEIDRLQRVRDTAPAPCRRVHLSIGEPVEFTQRYETNGHTGDAERASGSRAPASSPPLPPPDSVLRPGRWAPVRSAGSGR